MRLYGFIWGTHRKNHHRLKSEQDGPRSKSAWWLTYPSEKILSVGMTTFPIYGKIKAMFQTTNQKLMQILVFDEYDIAFVFSFFEVGIHHKNTGIRRSGWNMLE